MAPPHSEYSLDFDGTDDVVRCGDVPSLTFERTDAFTVSAWVQTSASGVEQTVLCKAEEAASTDDRGWALVIKSTGLVEFYLTHTSVTSNLLLLRTTLAVSLGVWVHLAAVYNGDSSAASTKIYIDGEEVPVTVVFDALTDTILNTREFQIGGRGNLDSLFNGRIDDPAMYDKALSAAEIQTIFNGGMPGDLTVIGPTVNLVGYWPIDGDTFPTVTDLSISGNDGTMTNMAAEDIVLDAPLVIESETADYGNYVLRVVGPNIQPVGLIADDPLPYGGLASESVGTLLYYRMRGVEDPGPGYVTWTVLSVPDFLGGSAPAPIRPDSVTVSSSWSSDETIEQIPVSKVESIETFSSPGGLTESEGISLVLVQTGQASWPDLGLVTLPPTPVESRDIVVKDSDGNANMKRITVDGNGNLIDGQATRVLSNSREALHVIFDGTAWRVI